MTFKETDDEQN